MKLLTDDELNKAFDDTFEKGMYFGYKPTEEEIFTEQLKSVAKAQLAQDQQEHDKVVAELEKIVDDNYRDRVKLWEALKGYIESLKQSR